MEPPVKRTSRKSDTNEKDNWNTPAARCKFVFAQSWRFFLSLFAPFLLLVIFLWKPEDMFEKAPYGLYITTLMAIYWVTECMPLAITSLLPVVLLPLFGLASSGEVCALYFNNIIIFMFGGCAVALSFEYSNLHTRIALFVMKSLGAETSVLLFGMMCTCMFLSCWMNNTSTSAMMVPVIFSVMDQYRKKLLPEGTPEELASSLGNPEAPSPVTKPVAPKPKSESALEVVISGGTEDNSAANENEETKAPLDPVDKTIKMTPEEFEDAVRYWEEEIADMKKYLRNIEVMLLLGVAASSNIGGTGVITGTGTNLIASAQLKSYQSSIGITAHVVNTTECLNPEHYYWELDFVRWISLNFLPMVVSNFIAWSFLAIYFEGPPAKLRHFINKSILRRRPPPGEAIREHEEAEVSASITRAIKERYDQLGSTTLHEWIVICGFSLLVVLWILKNPLFLRGQLVRYNRENDPLGNDTIKLIHPACMSKNANLKFDSGWGWARFFGDKCDESFIHDYVPTILICFLFFLLPKDAVYYKNIFRGGLDIGLDHSVLPLEYVAENIPWGPLFMLGGGFGIAMSIKTSKLGDFLQDIMQSSETLKALDQNSLIAFIICITAVLTTIASNTAVAVILAPVLLSLSSTVKVPPLYMLIAPIVSASYSFILPISTPPNAIVYDKGNMKQTDMMVPGLFLTILCNSNIFLFNITWIRFMLDVDSYNGECAAVINGTGGDGRFGYSIPSLGEEMKFADEIDDYSLIDGMDLID